MYANGDKYPLFFTADFLVCVCLCIYSFSLAQLGHNTVI